MPAKRDRRCLHGVGGYCFTLLLLNTQIYIDSLLANLLLWFHNERGRRTRRGNGPLKAGTGRRKPQQVRVQDSWKPLGAERHTKHRKRGEVKTIRAKKPPIEALYPELPARRPNKG